MGPTLLTNYEDGGLELKLVSKCPCSRGCHGNVKLIFPDPIYLKCVFLKLYEDTHNSLC